MKTKLFRSALSLLLALMLIVSVLAPAISAEEADIAAVAADGAVVEKHADNTSISKSDLQGVFGDSTSITNTAFYGYAPVPESGAELDTSTIVYVSGSSNITAGDWLALKTTASTGSILNRKPDWTNADKRSQLYFSVKTYYSASFSVAGSSDGALYLNGDPVDGDVRLYTDETYTVTAAEVEGFTCEVTGVTTGEAFTPSADLTVAATYTADASAEIALNVGDGGSAKIMSDGIEVTSGTIPAGKTFTVEAAPNENKGYKLDSIVVTKGGEEVEAVDGVYGPVGDGEVYAVTVTFIYDPTQKTLEVNAENAKLERSDLDDLFDGAYEYYGIAEENAPDTIEYLYDYNLLITHYKNDYDVTAGKYIIYGTDDGSVTSPNWTNAGLMELTVKLYYTGTFTVTGHEDGEVYLNGEAVSGSVRLYPDTEYTVTAKAIDEYTYAIDGAEDGAAFTPSAAVNVTVTYMKEAYAAFTVTSNEGGTVTVRSDGEVVTDRVNEGATFSVEAAPNANKGYKLESVVVTKDGEEVEPVEGADYEYGPVADGEVYAVTVTFTFDPPRVEKEVPASSAKIARSDLNSLFDGAFSYYGIAPASDPDNISYLAVALTSDYNVEDGAEYYIYGSNDGNILSPKWTNAKLMVMTVRTYYNGTFTVTGHDDGEVYLNGEAVDGSVRLYTDEEYTVTVKEIEEYGFVLEGAEAGAAFTPTADVNVTVAYTKLAYATFTLTASEGGTAQVQVNGEAVADRISEGETFTVVATPNTNRGYVVESVVVTKDGESVEPVEGADYEYGPAADGEEYAITVTFKYDPPRVSRDVDANKGQVSRSDLNSLFDGAYNYYGIADADTPDDITYLAVALTADYSVEVDKEYIIYGTNDGNILSPRWTNAKLMVMTVRTYYNGSFTVSAPEGMPEDGAVYLNGEAVSGNVKLYTDETYTVTAKDGIEGYICTLYGAEDGEEFTPTADLDVTAAYVKETYATVTLNANEGGTVDITSDGEAVFDMIPEGSSFTVSVTADAAHDYYVESFTVLKDGEAVEPVDGVYGPVVDGESYEVNVSFAQATLTLDDCDVVLLDIKDQKFDEIAQTILSSATLTPAAFADAAVTKVEYRVYTLLGYEGYESLDYSGNLYHQFGYVERDGELMEGNTEKVRVTYTLAECGIELQATAAVTVKDVREATRLEGGNVTITYGDDLKAAVMDIITVYNADGEPIEFTADDITITPETPNARLLSTQEITVIYGGSERYAICRGTVNAYVRRAESSIDTKSETITYGETPACEVITTPEDLDYICIIAGIDGEAQGYVSIDIPESVKEKMRFSIGDFVVLDIYQALQDYIGDGTSLNGLKELFLNIYETVNSSETISQGLEENGFNIEILDGIAEFINRIPDIDANLKITLNRPPTNAGAYLMCAISTDSNYTISADVSYIVIKPVTNDEENSVELRFKSEFEDSENVLSYEEAQEFVFGGDFYLNDVLQETDKLHTVYAGVTLEGEFVSGTEPFTEPGVYTETIYLLGGNYLPAPIIRAYRVTRIVNALYMDDMVVAYDGEAHSPVAYFEDGTDTEDIVTYQYIGAGYFSSEAPVNAGEYTVYAYYSGDDDHEPSGVFAKLTIEKVSAVITVTCAEEVVYGDIGFFNIDAAGIEYSVSGTIGDDNLGIIVPVCYGENYPNVGEYTVTVLFVPTNFNYDVTIESATLTIVPKEIIVTIDDAEKNVGEDDPGFTYTVTDAEGNTILPWLVGLTVEREEGEEAGTYRIYVADFNADNFTIDEESSTEGVFTIKEQVKRTYIRGDADGDGEVSIIDATLIQRKLAEMPGLEYLDDLAADVDGDGEVTIIDVTLIQRYLAFMPNHYNIGEEDYEVI